VAERDRQRLLQRALDLPQALESDFFGRRPPSGVKPELLKRINDTALRTKLVEARLAEGLQSPKGPQKIASIVRIYPAFDAPPRGATNGRIKRSPVKRTPERGLPSLEDMERLVSRVREVETEVERELAAQIDERIDVLKRGIAALSGDELEAAYHQLGEALESKRALAAQIRLEALRRVESDASFAQRAYLRLLRR
jgi:hypothetical protein